MEDNYKKGDWVYTKQWDVGVFRIYKIDGNRIYNQPQGWVDKSHKTLRLAEIHEIPVEFRKDILSNIEIY